MMGKTKGLRKHINSLAKSKVKLPCIIWISYRKTLSNELQGKINDLKSSGLRICNYQDKPNLSVNKWDIIIVQVESLSRIEFSARPLVAILNETNVILRQMSSDANAWESENAMPYCGENIRVIDNKFQPLVDKTVKYFYDPNSETEAMRIGYELLQQGKHVAFVLTSCHMARALVEKASKLQKPDNSHIRACAYYGDIDGKQRKKDFSDINTAWGELDCVAYISTIEAGISFEKTNHFDAVIGITNITTPVNIEAFIQMMFRIRNYKKQILSFYYQKNSSDLFRPPGYENIRAELESARPNNLPTAIRGYRELDKNIVSYKLDQSPAVISYLEVEHQKRFSARNFIEISCSLIASTGASLQLIKMDESRDVIRNCKIIRNEVRVEALVIKESDFDAVATSQNLSPEEAENLKFDQEHSIPDTMALKRFYMRNIYGDKDMSNDDWNNLCKKKFIERFSPPEPRKHFLRLSHLLRQGCDEDSAIEGLVAKDFAQWEDICFKAENNFEKS
ncbi:5160_t:CDS:2, partial [Funneliformis geosporum]